MTLETLECIEALDRSETAEDWYQSLGYEGHPAVEPEDLDASNSDEEAVALALSREEGEEYTEDSVLRVIAQEERDLARAERLYYDGRGPDPDDMDLTPTRDRVEAVAYGRMAWDAAQAIRSEIERAVSLAEAGEWDEALEAARGASSMETDWGDDPMVAPVREALRRDAARAVVADAGLSDEALVELLGAVDDERADSVAEIADEVAS